jgi:acetyl esterase
MAYDVGADPRLDPRVKAFLAYLGPAEPEGDVDSRETLLAEANSEEARAGAAEFGRLVEQFDAEAVAPPDGLRTHTEKVISQPDGNTINLQVIRPDTDEALPCVYYIHGGGMGYLSCFDAIFQGWGKLIAGNGVAVVMVDFRNAVVPSSVPEVAPFPAGLNDCVSGLKWVVANAARLAIDPGRVIVAGESGGGNLTLATGLKLKRDGELGLVGGLYAMAPFIRGQWPAPDCPSSIENNGIFMDVHTNRGTVGYGLDAFTEGNPLAWPSFATTADVEGFPPVVISVNECDPLRDEGVNFYRLLLAAGVPARCRQVMGTMHAVETFINLCPDISRDTARDIAAFPRDVAAFSRDVAASPAT